MDMLVIWSHPDTCRVRPSNVSFACTASLRSYVTPKYLTAGVAIPYQLHLLFLGVLGEGYPPSMRSIYLWFYTELDDATDTYRTRIVSYS